MESTNDQLKRIVEALENLLGVEAAKDCIDCAKAHVKLQCKEKDDNSRNAYFLKCLVTLGRDAFKEEEKKNRKWKWVVAGAVTVLSVAVGGLCLMANSSAEPPPNPPTEPTKPRVYFFSDASERSSIILRAFGTTGVAAIMLGINVSS